MSDKQDEPIAVRSDNTTGKPTETFNDKVTHSLALPARIVALDIGQTCSESQFLNFDTTDKAAFEQSIKALRSTMSKAASRANSRTGNTYITVTGDHRTRDGDIIVVATVVRTA